MIVKGTLIETAAQHGGRGQVGGWPGAQCCQVAQAQQLAAGLGRVKSQEGSVAGGWLRLGPAQHSRNPSSWRGQDGVVRLSRSVCMTRGWSELQPLQQLTVCLVFSSPSLDLYFSSLSFPQRQTLSSEYGRYLSSQAGSMRLGYRRANFMVLFLGQDPKERLRSQPL